MSKTNIAIVIIIIALITAGVFLWFQYRGISPEDEGDTGTRTVEQASLGEDIFSQIESGNPVEGLPEANPFNEVNTNPLKNAYKNPFE